MTLTVEANLFLYIDHTKYLISIYIQIQSRNSVCVCFSGFKRAKGGRVGGRIPQTILGGDPNEVTFGPNRMSRSGERGGLQIYR